MQRRGFHAAVVRVGLILAVAIALSLTPLAGGSTATAADSGVPKIRLDSAKNIWNAVKRMGRGKKVEIVLPKQGASTLARKVYQRQAEIEKLASWLRSKTDGEWACEMAGWIDKVGSLYGPGWKNATMLHAALEENGNYYGALQMVDAIDALGGISNNVVVKTVSAACQF